jgi:hypothetical protein
MNLIALRVFTEHYNRMLLDRVAVIDELDAFAASGQFDSARSRRPVMGAILVTPRDTAVRSFRRHTFGSTSGHTQSPSAHEYTLSDTRFALVAGTLGTRPSKYAHSSGRPWLLAARRPWKNGIR